MEKFCFTQQNTAFDWKSLLLLSKTYFLEKRKKTFKIPKNKKQKNTKFKAKSNFRHSRGLALNFVWCILKFSYTCGKTIVLLMFSSLFV